MSPEAWLSLAAILVTLALAGASLVVGVVGWLLIQTFKGVKQTAESALSMTHANRNKITRLETVLVDRGLLPQTVKYPSPPPKTFEETG